MAPSETTATPPRVLTGSAAPSCLWTGFCILGEWWTPQVPEKHTKSKGVLSPQKHSQIKDLTGP